MDEIWQNARELRNAATDAEKVLWQHLRGRRLSGLKFRRQYPIAGYIADFACIEARLVIELGGGQHADRQAYDAERTRKLETNGYRYSGSGMTMCCCETSEVLDEVLRCMR